jgi:uncharacterized protein with HEPN domain
MSRRDTERLQDIRDAITAIRSHVSRGDLSDGLIFDAVRVRLIEIGEAIKALPAELVDTEPEIPWADIAGMRDRLAHHYFDTEHSIVAATVTSDSIASKAPSNDSNHDSSTVGSPSTSAYS